MLPTPYSYNIMPGVILADSLTTMTITANERAYIMNDGDAFTVNIISVAGDENYYEPSGGKKINLVAKDGALVFDFTFQGEGEHLVRLIKEETVVAGFVVYSVYSDLYERRPLKGDLHSHSVRSDGTRDPASQAGHYREQGYDFMALTDHNRFYPGIEVDEVYEVVDTGLVRIRGEEVHSPGSVVHIVHVGGRESVADRYVHDRENYDKEIEGYMSKVPSEVPEVYKSRYAKAMWATDAIHSVGGLAIFPHPFWRPGAKTYNVTEELARILLKSGMFDAYEIVGAMTQQDSNRSLALWCDLRAEGYKIPVVASSDVHNLERSIHFPNNQTIAFPKEKTCESIMEAVKSGMCVALETNGENYSKQYRCYGDFRLVSYAQFLLSNYFPRLQRITAGIGVAMRAYAMEECDASVIEGVNKIADNFTERFFGRMAAKLPSARMIEDEERWRKTQLDGPPTRGSSVDSAPAKSLI